MNLRTIMRFGALILTLFAVGVVLFAIYAIKHSLWGKEPVTLAVFCLIVVSTMMAGVLLSVMDWRSQRLREQRERVRPKAGALTGLERICADAYAPFGAFSVREEPLPSAMGNHLQAVKILEDLTWNYHRVIVIARVHGAIPEYGAVRDGIRNWCGTILHPSKLKGLGVGIVVDAAGSTIPGADDLLGLIDVRSRFPATIQWVIWYNRADLQAGAAHMFIEGSTTPCFVACCKELAKDGFALDLQVRQPDGLLRWASRLHRRMPWWMHILGP